MEEDAIVFWEPGDCGDGRGHRVACANGGLCRLGGWDVRTPEATLLGAHLPRCVWGD